MHTLTNRRYKEDTIAYCESHDQALVGDKTLAFWLMDKEMYTHMSKLVQRTPVIDRGLALHKMIRMLTMAIGGEGYLTFMGNEFGHPEWLDFPREGNNSSFHYARRQFDLACNQDLHYSSLEAFEKGMLQLEKKTPFLHGEQYVSLAHEGDKMIVAERGAFLFIFNFHPTQSFVDYQIGTRWGTKHRIALDSDWEEFSGFQRVDPKTVFTPVKQPWNNREFSIKVYVPSRTCLVLSHE